MVVGAAEDRIGLLAEPIELGQIARAAKGRDGAIGGGDLAIGGDGQVEPDEWTMRTWRGWADSRSSSLRWEVFGERLVIRSAWHRRS